jgi:hypothetical protein
MIRSDWHEDATVAMAYCLGDATVAESVAGRVRIRLVWWACPGLSKVCQVVRVDQIPRGAYLVDDGRWFDCALISSLGCSSSCLTFALVSIALIHCPSAILPWCPNRVLRMCRSSV